MNTSAILPPMTHPAQRVPAAAMWLGGLGALPFVSLAVASVLLDPPHKGPVLFALVAYGAVILSFLGGIHWGLAIAASAAGSRPLLHRLVASVVPSLVGWAALLLPDAAAMIVLAVAFALLLVFDTRASRRGEAPAWYATLRWPLTTIVVAALVTGAFTAGQT